MALPKFLEPFLPSYDISKMALRDPGRRQEIIIQLLNFGDTRHLRWLFRTYSQREIKEVIAHPQRGMWQARALNHWTKIFNIKGPKLIYEVAIFSLKPRPKLTERYFNYLKREGKVPKRTLKAREEIDKLEKVRKRKAKKQQQK